MQLVSQWPGAKYNTNLFQSLRSNYYVHIYKLRNDMNPPRHSSWIQYWRGDNETFKYSKEKYLSRKGTDRCVFHISEQMLHAY